MNVKNVKHYQAATINQAMDDVLHDMGKEAVILKTRKFRTGGLFGIAGKRRWEITAANDVEAPRYFAAGRYVESGPIRKGAGIDLSGQLRELKETIESVMSADGCPQKHANLSNLHRHLLDQDVENDIASDLVNELAGSLTGEQLDDGRLVKSKLHEMIASRISTTAATNNPGRVIACVGPTGVGKTTTIAKLAAGFKIAGSKRVGLITIDTYRIAAVDQLKTYAEIIDVPLRAVINPGELKEAIRKMKDLDVVLIDTTGRSPADVLKLNQLRRFITAAQADEVHLVVSATTGMKGLRRAVENFHPMGVNRLIVTKLDEAPTAGVILNLAGTDKLALSYCTSGQEVPDDISQAQPDTLAGLIVGGARLE